MKKDYKKPINEILSASSLQFLLSPFRSKRLLIKLIWICFLISSIIASIYCVGLNIIDYLKYDITSTIEVVDEFQSEFPTISFCNNRTIYFDMKIIEFRFDLNNYANEWENHFEKYNDTTYGYPCYRFNSGKNLRNEQIPIKKLRKSGLVDGLRLSFSSSLFDYDSVAIYIHNKSQTPTTIFNKETFISTGMENYFIIKRTFDTKLDLPYNNCLKNLTKSIFNKTIFNYLTLNRNSTYTQEECKNLCRNFKFNESSNCSCKITSLDFEVYHTCYFNKSNRDKNCVDDFMFNFDLESCINYCPLECDSYYFDITMYKRTIINTDVKYYQIYVYYEDLRYTYLNQKEKIELFGLISNIGGTLGLFLGFSCINILEIFELFIELIFVLLRIE